MTLTRQAIRVRVPTEAVFDLDRINPPNHQLPFFVSKNPRLQFLQIRQVLSLLPVMMVSPS